MHARIRRSGIGSPAAGVAVGVVIAIVALLVSRLAGVATPTVLAAGVALAWLVAVGAVVAQALKGASTTTRDEPTPRSRSPEIDDDAGSPTADSPEFEGTDARRAGESPLAATSDPAWLRSDETPWAEDGEGEESEIDATALGGTEGDDGDGEEGDIDGTAETSSTS